MGGAYLLTPPLKRTGVALMELAAPPAHVTKIHLQLRCVSRECAGGRATHDATALQPATYCKSQKASQRGRSLKSRQHQSECQLRESDCGDGP